MFRSRTPKTITVHELGQAITYQLLTILDFNNIRKRMSVIGEVLGTARQLGGWKGCSGTGARRLSAMCWGPAPHRWRRDCGGIVGSWLGLKRDLLLHP